MNVPARALLLGAFSIALGTPASAAWAAAVTSAGGPATVPAASVARAPNPQTMADLDQALRGEAFANAAYRLYADQARREGHPSIARTFERAAGVESGEHFPEAAKLRGLVGSDTANLQDAIKGEGYESTTMYPTFANRASAAGDTNAAGRFSEIAKDEGTHRDAFATAQNVLRTGKGTIPAAPAVNPVRVPAGAAEVKARQTKTDLDTALHGEALANLKYTQYAKHASAGGNAALGRLFRGNAGVERRQHFAEQARLAGLVGSTSDNLTKAIAGERYESTTMYPGMAERARTAGDTEAARLFAHNAGDEAGHARAFERARSGLGG